MEKDKEQVDNLVVLILEMRQEMMNAPKVEQGQVVALLATYDALLHRLTEKKAA